MPLILKPQAWKNFASEINRWCGSLPRQCLQLICLDGLGISGHIHWYWRHVESVHLSSIGTWPPLQSTSPRKHDNATLWAWPSHRHPLAALVTSSLGKEQYHVCSLELFSKSDICKTMQKHHHPENTESNQLSIWLLNTNFRFFQLNLLTWRMAVYNITEPATRPSRRAWRRSLFFKTFLLGTQSSSLGSQRSTGTKLQHPTQLGVAETHKLMWTSQGGKEIATNFTCQSIHWQNST